MLLPSPLFLLLRHWRARRHYPWPSWLACIARSLRVLLFPRAHRRLLALDVVRRYVVPAHDDVFHHLSHRDYLARGLTLRQRVACVLVHYRFEDLAFDDAFKRAVYRNGGLPLWRHEAGGRRFAIRLEMASRLCAEGDLTIVASCDGACLHRLSFSWVDVAFAGVATPWPMAAGSTVLPFVARNQGHRADAAVGFAAFESAFPNNSPSFFCFAALQGLALALGMDQAVAVKAAWQCAWTPQDAARFENAYDRFWETLGGEAMTGRCWRIPLPIRQKPLSEVASKHRKRAAQRREHWRAVGESAQLALAGHLALAPAVPGPQSRTAGVH